MSYAKSTMYVRSILLSKQINKCIKKRQSVTDMQKTKKTS